MRLEQIISEISIKQEDLQKVIPARDYLIELLRSYASQRIIPEIKSYRIIGSYKRKTKIKPLDDIDILIILGNGHYQNNDWHMIDDCNHVWAQDDHDENGNLSSIRILNKIRKKLIESYPQSEIKRNNEVVNVYLKSYDIGFDIVPCFYYRDVDYFLIPAGANSTKWKKTNPIKDEFIIDKINSKNSGKIKPIIRLAKQFFMYKKIPSLRSYHLEACAYEIFNQISGNYSLVEYLSYFFSKLSFELMNSCPDPTQISEPLSSGLQRNQIETILESLSFANRILNKNEGEYCEYVGFTN